jgi:hypothetical protein
MVLTKRQETAQRLTRELQAFGATVTNVLPLADAQPSLRFWVTDYRKNELLQQLKDAGYEPTFVKMEPQMDIGTYSMGLVNVFELAVPADRQEIPQNDRIVKDEIGKRKDSEIMKTYQSVYGKQR